MMKFLLLALCGVLLAGVSAQAPPHNGTKAHRCCIPSKEFVLGYGSNVATGNSYYRQYVAGAYDFTSRKYGSVSDVTYINGTTIRVRIIILAAEGVQFYIFNGTCTKLHDVFVEPSRCITEDYDHVSTYQAGDNEIELNVWGAAINDSKHGTYGTNFVSYSAQSCVPVAQSSLVYLGTPPQLASVTDSGGYMNFTRGIQDPNFWFVPPSFCPPAQAKVKRSDSIPLHHRILSQLAFFGSWTN